MKSCLNSIQNAAFSLLEIVIALGLFGVIIASILGLFPATLRTDKESNEETQALFIASGVMDTLATPNGEGPLLLVTGMSNNIPVLSPVALEPGKNTSLSVLYNDACEPLRKLSGEEVAASVSDHNAASVVTINLSSKSSLPGVITAEVSVASPSSAPAASRSVLTFTRLLTAPNP